MIQRSLLGVIQLMHTHEEKAFSEFDRERIGELADILGNALLRLQHAA